MDDDRDEVWLRIFGEVHALIQAMATDEVAAGLSIDEKLQRAVGTYIDALDARDAEKLYASYLGIAASAMAGIAVMVRRPVLRVMLKAGTARPEWAPLPAQEQPPEVLRATVPMVDRADFVEGRIDALEEMKRDFEQHIGCHTEYPDMLKVRESLDAHDADNEPLRQYAADLDLGAIIMSHDIDEALQQARWKLRKARAAS